MTMLEWRYFGATLSSAIKNQSVAGVERDEIRKYLSVYVPSEANPSPRTTRH